MIEDCPPPEGCQALVEISVPDARFVPGALIEAKLVKQFQKLFGITSSLDPSFP